MLVSEHFQADEKPDGIYVYPQGDRSAAPSGHMPKTGFFFDSIVRQGEIDEDSLKVEDNLEEFGPMKPDDSEFDIINPVQCSAKGMEAKTLKERQGDRITFWGGGVNTQKTLPFGTPEEVRAEVLERCETFAPGGGFVFNAIHNVQALTPTQNVVAMIEAVHSFNGGVA